MIIQMMQVVSIVNLVDEPESLLLELVHTICERFSSIDDEDDVTIELRCKEPTLSHLVSPSGFVLLRQAENVTGLLLHKVARVEKSFHSAFSGISGSLLTSLTSLVNLEEEPLLSLNLFHVNCNSREESLARIALLQKSRSWNIDFLDVRSHGLGGEGWSGLARAVRRGMIVCLSKI